MSAYDQAPYFQEKCREKGLPFPPSSNTLTQIDINRLLLFERNLISEVGTEREISTAFLDSLVDQYEKLYHQRGKRRQGQQLEDGFQLPAKTSKAKHHESQPIETSNAYEVLNTSEQMEHSSIIPETTTAGTSINAPKTKKPPPIIVQYNKDMEQLMKLFKTQFHNDTSAEYLPQGQLKIKPTTTEERNMILKLLQDHSIGYYTYGEPEISNIKYVLKGLPPSFDQANIINAFQENEITLLRIRQLKRALYNNDTNSKEVIPLPVWVLTIPRTPEMTQKLKLLTGIEHIKISIESYKSNNSLLQCYRCQGLGHKAQLCTLPPKCVKCGGGHNTRDCKKAIEIPATCANCGGEHPANFRNCPKILKYQKRQENRQSAQKPVPSTNSFPKLRPTTSRIPGFQYHSNNEETTATDFEDIKHIIQFLRTDKFKNSIKSFKTLITEVRIQPDKMSKIFTFCAGFIDIVANVFD